MKSTIKRTRKGAIIARIRKPIAPPSQTMADETKYSRARERERKRREEEGT